MFRRALVSMTVLLVGCNDPPDPKTIEGAFALVADAAERGMSRDLFRRLDEESRGSVSAVHKAQREANRLVERDYPAEERSRAVGRWRLGAEAEDPGGVFAAWCEKTRCIAQVRDRLSAIEKTVRHGNRARVRVRRGREYPFERSRSGGWGLSLFAERLRRWKVEVYRDLAAIRASARIYREGS